MKTFDNLEDFDKYHPIPRELGKYNYIYASGGKKDEVYRHFVVPIEVYETYRDKAKADFRLAFMSDNNPFRFRKRDGVNMIAPFENSYGYKMLLLTACTSSNPDNRNCELRNKRKILKQFTTQELDIVEKEARDSESTEDEKNKSKNETENEVEDDADNTPHS